MRNSLFRILSSAPVLFLVCVVSTTAGCSLVKIAADQTVEVFDLAAPSFDKEYDVELARAAGLANLKMVEGLIEVVPENRQLLMMLGKAYTSYSYGFVEDEMEVAEPFSDEYDRLTRRAVDFYDRGRFYATQAIELSHPGFGKAMAGTLDGAVTALAAIDVDDVDALVWIGQAWAAGINLRADDPAAIVELPKAVAVMERVVELDETVFLGGAHTVLGASHAAVPAELGGNAEAAKKHLDRAIEISEGRYLLSRFALAQYYYGGIHPEREGFEATLNGIIDAPDDLMPEQRLSNEIAKIRAQRLLDRADDIF